jgi:phage-related minor tail protein
MSDSYGVSDAFTPAQSGDLSGTLGKVSTSTNTLGVSATAFANAITKAFAQATTGGKQFDDVLKSLALRLSNLSVQAALKPLAKDAVKGFNGIINNILGGGSTSSGPVLTPFASGGVVGAPTYFPLSGGGLGLAGEAGPEAIVPLTRGSDGRLGVSVAGPSAPANVTVQIATPDAASFRRSEAYITGQIARAVARGQRSL